MKIDESDMKIVEILEENGRIPNKEIAKRLELSEGTIRNRIAKLTHEGFLKVKGLTNPSVRTDKQLVYIMAKVPLHKGWDETGQRVAELHDVKSVSLVAGDFDLLVEVFVEPNKLASFINEQLGSIETIDSTKSIVALRHYNKWV